MPTSAPKAAKPSKVIFDPFNSSATGHQRADNSLNGSTSWRDSRKLKLDEQFTAGTGGGKRVSDTVGAGSLGFGQDGRTENGGWLPGAKGLRTGGQASIWESMKIEKEAERTAKRARTEDDASKPSCIVNPYTPFKKQDGMIRESSWTSHEASPSELLSPLDAVSSSPVLNEESAIEQPTDDVFTSHVDQDERSTSKPSCPQIFAGLTIYINGSTAKYISDHKLKHLMAQHGANLSISRGRRTVTHVIVGKPGEKGQGAGGGLAGSKIHKEITRIGGKSVKFVTAEWVVESVKAGKRLPELRFEGLRLAPKGVGSVAAMFGKKAGTEKG